MKNWTVSKSLSVLGVLLLSGGLLFWGSNAARGNMIPHMSGTPDFLMSAAPSSLTIAARATGESTITIASANGFSGTVTLATTPSPLCPSPYCTVWSLYPSTLTLVAGATANATLTIMAGTPGTGTGDLPVVGTSGSLSHSVNVKFTIIVSPPTVLAAFTYNPCVFCAAPGDVVFFNANWSIARLGGIASYAWDFGDGSSVLKTNGSQVTHMYGGVPAMWNVTLTVTAQDGTTDTIKQLVLFWVAPSFTFHPRTPFIGEKVVFDGSSSRAFGPKIEGGQWDFGDNSTGSGLVANHSYVRPGAYRVTLTLLTSEGNPSVSETILVWKSPDVDDDGSIGINDLIAVWVHQFSNISQFDLNSDGNVELDDLLFVYVNQFRTV